MMRPLAGLPEEVRRPLDPTGRVLASADSEHPHGERKGANHG